jgi:hypothetical protein
VPKKAKAIVCLSPVGDRLRRQINPVESMGLFCKAKVGEIVRKILQIQISKSGFGNISPDLIGPKFTREPGAENIFIFSPSRCTGESQRNVFAWSAFRGGQENWGSQKFRRSRLSVYILVSLHKPQSLKAIPNVKMAGGLAP